MARLKDVGFAERREAAVNSRLDLLKKMQARVQSPESEARAADHRKIVEARNKRNAEREEARRKEEARLAAIRAAEQAKLDEERRIREEEERIRREAEEAAEQARLEAEKARLAASSSARAARALAELTMGRMRRGSGNSSSANDTAEKQARQA